MRLLLPALLLLALSALNAQRTETSPLDSLYAGLEFRHIGPFRGGRTNAVTGVAGQPLRYYFGGTGGGVWRTDDAGQSWRNISDGFFRTGSVGAIAVAPSDANVLYVGTGEHAVRGVMSSAGDGIYKSTDGGKSWTHLGLEDSRHIAAIRVHPSDPETVYVAVQGAVHGDSETRGVYRSRDGGETWERILYVDATTGAADLSLDQTNPRILYAGMWDHRRYPWAVRSGGPGSGLYKSTDGGDNWERLTEGLPDTLGKVAIDVSPVNPERVYANLEARGEAGGVYRSDDGGETWSQTSSDRATITRSWYYTEIFADPVDANRVYVLNAGMLRSIDGGNSFQSVANPHSDQHDLWINPENTENMILGNDGGATVTLNGGKTWSTQQNQPTAQFYRVITDKLFPYNLYAGQQDNSSVETPSRTRGGGIGWKDWQASAGGESAFPAFDPDDPRYVYGGSYQGNLSVMDRETGTERDVMAYPVVGLGTQAKDQRYRFNWNAPLVAQPQDPQIMYHGANVVLRTDDGGHSWTEISGDLTRNDSTKQTAGGYPFTNEGAGGENYNTISYLTASPHRKGEIWVGTDDGLVWHTPDEGATWNDVTPKGIGETQINAIEVSPHDPDKVYLAVTSYKFNDFRPMVYVTEDAGKRWRNRAGGISPEDYVHAVREDRIREGLLYAGTTRGLYVSFDDGNAWTRFQRNLPVAPINDLTLQDNDLVVATSGRAFWILDDLSALQQTTAPANAPTTPALYRPKPTYRYNFSTPQTPPTNEGTNPASGITFDYFLPEALDTQILEVVVSDARGNELRQFSNQDDETFKTWPGGPPPAPTLPAERGLNRFNWDLRRATLPAVGGVFVMGDYRGGLVAPGDYTIQLRTPMDTQSVIATLLADPTVEASAADYVAQQKVTRGAEMMVRDLHEAVNRMRKVTAQLTALNDRLAGLDGTEDLVERGHELIERLTAWEEKLIQPQQKTFQDVINYPNQLNAELMNLKSRADGAVPGATAGVQERMDDLEARWVGHRKTLRQLIEGPVADYNRAYRDLGLDVLVVPD